MVFNIAIAFLGYVNLIAAVRWYRTQQTRALTCLAAAISATFAGFVGYISQPDFSSSADINWSAPLLLISALISVAVHGRRLMKELWSKDQSPVVWRSGITALTLLSSLYMIAAVTDHYWFLYGKPRTGVAYISTSEGVKDIPCRRVVLFQMDDVSEMATYRCPFSAISTTDNGDPFLPLFSYYEGQSKDLRRALENNHISAKYLLN